MYLFLIILFGPNLILNKDGKTPLYLAKYKNSKEIIKHIEQYTEQNKSKNDYKELAKVEGGKLIESGIKNNLKSYQITNNNASNLSSKSKRNFRE